MAGHPRRHVVVSAAIVVLIVGCRAPQIRPAYRTLDAHPRRNTFVAQTLNAEGLRYIEKAELHHAERKFREALDQDLYYPPAHNNLGLVLLQMKRYYEAACEFEFAAKLAPRAVEPRGNLGVLYEQVGMLDKGMAEYEAVLQVDPNHLETMQHLARAYVKAGREDGTLRGLLERLILVSEDEHWNHWARGRIIRLGRKDTE
jgi:Tfp pilus assembly protein PilF